MEGQFPIRGSLEGHSNLLTGGTGFVGSLILEQLLRCVPGIDTVSAHRAAGDLLCTDKPGGWGAGHVQTATHTFTSQVYVLIRDGKGQPAAMRLRRSVPVAQEQA